MPGKAIIIILVAGFLAACGSDDSGPATKESFVAEANDICEEMNEEIAENPAQSTAAEELAETLEAGRQITLRAMARIRALEQPPGSEAELDDISQKVDAFLADADVLVQKLRAGDPEASEVAQARLEKSEAASNSAFAAYGLTACAE